MMKAHGQQRIWRYAAVTGCALAVLISAGCATSKSNEWVARVNGKSVMKEDFDKRLTEMNARYKGQVPTEKDGKKYDTYRGTIAEDMATRILIRDEATKRGITVTGKEVDQGIQEVIKAQFASDKKAFDKELKKEGLTLERAREQLKDGMIVEKLKQKITSSVKEPAEKDIKIVYLRNPKQFQLVPAVKIRHVLVKTKADAQKVVQRLEKGEDMEKIAKEVSKDPLAKKNAGLIGWIKKGSSEAAIEEAAFVIPVGRFSEPIQTKYGWHVIRVEDTKPAYQRTYEQARSTILNGLMEEKRTAAWDSWLAKLKKSAKIQYADGYKPEAK